MRDTPLVSFYGPIKLLITSWKGALGKTLKSVEEEFTGRTDFLVFRFTDDSALLLKRDVDDDNVYGDPDELRPWGNGMLTWYSDDFWDRVFFGLEPIETWEEKQVEHERAELAQEETREKELLARLKAKYEDGVD